MNWSKTNVFKKDGTYYMVFDGTEQIRDFIDDVIVADGWGIVMGHFQRYLEEAYRVYQKALNCWDDLSEKNIVFLGHSLGGALAFCPAVLWTHDLDADGVLTSLRVAARVKRTGKTLTEKIIFFSLKSFQQFSAFW